MNHHPSIDDPTGWYLQDADRVLQVEAYESGYHHHRRIHMVARLLRRAGVREILDLGCGDGWQVNKLTRDGFSLIGSDIALKRLLRARANAPGATGYFVSDLNRQALRRDSIQCIYLGQVLEHLPRPGEVLLALREALVPGGYLILDTPCRDNLIDDLIRLTRLPSLRRESADWGLRLDPGHLHFFGRDEVLSMLRDCGYLLCGSRGAPCLRWNAPRIGNVLATHRRLWPLHDLLENLLGCVPRVRHSGAILVCLARRPPAGGAPPRRR